MTVSPVSSRVPSAVSTVTVFGPVRRPWPEIRSTSFAEPTRPWRPLNRRPTIFSRKLPTLDMSIAETLMSMPTAFASDGASASSATWSIVLVGTQPR